MKNDPQVLALKTQCANAPVPRQDLALVTAVTPPPPSTVGPGSPFVESVKFTNGGNTTWAGAHSLFFLPPQSGGQVVWSAPPPSDLTVGSNPRILPGEEANKTITVIAPTQPGTYDFAFAVHDPAGNLIGQSLLTQITVEAPSASLTFINAPNSLTNDPLGAQVTAVATNDGHFAWTPGNYLLQLLRINRISLSQNSFSIPAGGVAPGASVAFTFTITCNGVGTGGFNAQMVGPSGRFGQLAGKTVVCQ
jgi:hypothetical protein